MDGTEDIYKVKKIARTTRARVLRAVALTILIIVVGVPLMYMTVAQVIGEGFTFTAAASLQAHRYLRSIEDGEYEKAASLLGFSRFDDTSAVRQKYAADIAVLFGELFPFQCYRNIYFITDDGFTTGSADLNLSITFDYTIRFAVQGGRLTVMRVDAQSGDDTLSAKQLSDILRTYDPG